jgi:hypothetical protein
MDEITLYILPEFGNIDFLQSEVTVSGPDGLLSRYSVIGKSKISLGQVHDLENSLKYAELVVNSFAPLQFEPVAAVAVYQVNFGEQMVENKAVKLTPGSGLSTFRFKFCPRFPFC